MMEKMSSLLQKGAKNAIVDCLAVKPEDRVFIITDEATRKIGQALLDEAKSITPESEMVILEDYAKRPFKELPEKLKKDLIDRMPTVTIFAAEALGAEMATLRHPLHRFIPENINSRHAHMIGIKPVHMETGMQVDYRMVSARGNQIRKFLENAKRITAVCPYGTDLEVIPTSKYKWVLSDGVITKPGDWMNLPNGEIFTTPKNVNGKLAAHVFGDFGLLKEPIIVGFKNSRVIDVEGNDKEVIGKFREIIKTDENADRVGEFALGINEFITELTGNLLQDEKFPGIHVAVGDPIGTRTGAEWESDIHVDMVSLETTIKVDGKIIMKDGKFVI